MAFISVFLVVLYSGGVATENCVISGDVSAVTRGDVVVSSPRSFFVSSRDECRNKKFFAEDSECADSNGDGLQQPQGYSTGKGNFTFAGFSLKANKALGPFDVVVHQKHKDKGTLCYSHKGGGESAVVKDCGHPLDGIYMEFYPRKGDILADVCEFIAFGAPAEVSAPGTRYPVVAQSSLAYGGLAEYAIDGRYDAEYFSYSCTHTDNTYRPWWYADLGGVRTVTSVNILNRGDCCSGRLTNFDIAVVDTPPDQSCTNAGAEGCRNYEVEGTLCHTQGTQYVSGEWKNFTCARPITGRYLVVQLKRRNYLTLCEVQVKCSGLSGNCIAGSSEGRCPHGFKPDGSCKGYEPDCENAAQISTAYRGFAAYAIDGKFNTSYEEHSCSHTDNIYRPWWYVSLGGPKTVTSVRILNRGDCCAERLIYFEIAVVDTPPDQSCTKAGDQGCRNYAEEGTLCHTQGSQYVSGAWKNFTCANPVTGRYLVVQLKGRNALTLCEVQATCSGINGNCLPGC